RLFRLLRQQGIPQQEIVLPPRMVSREVNVLPPKSRRQAVLNSSLVLSYRDQLLRSRRAHGVAHGLDPVRERLLREKNVIVNLERIVANIHAALVEFDVLRKGKQSGSGDGRDIPRGGQCRTVRISLVQPFVPLFEFYGIPRWTHRP